MRLTFFARRFGLAALLLLASFMPAFAVQGGGCVPTSGNVTAVQFAEDINAGFAAGLSSNSGPTAPTNDCLAATVVGQVWWDTSGVYPVLRYWDGTQGLPVGFFDLNNHVFMPQSGGGVATLASANTVDLCSIPQDYVTISGTVSILSFGSSCAVGQSKKIAFSAATTITYNASAILTDNAASITTANGDQAEAIYLGAGIWRVLNYRSAKGPQDFSSGVANGTATAITLSQTIPSNFVTSLGVRLTFIAANSSAAGGTTLTTPDGATNAIKKLTGSGLADLVAGDINSGQSVDLWYDGSYWELINQTAFPTGAVVGFALSSCPTGWTAANGSNGAIDARGVVLRGQDNGAGKNPAGTLAVGTYQADQVGPMGFANVGLAAGTFAYAGGGGTQNSVTNGNFVQCNSGCGTETRARNVTVLFCQKL
jgi:hypothetical protein